MSTEFKPLYLSDLAQFTGTEQWYRHGLVRSVLYTDGAKYVAEHGGAYWLLDEIALAQRFDQDIAAEEFQLWILSVDLERRSGVLRCTGGNGRCVREKEIAFTDFPLAEIKLYYTGNVILLPSEY